MRNDMRNLFLGGIATCTLLLSGCWERPPIEPTQNGYRGLAMGEMINPRLMAAKTAANALPEVLPPALEGGPTAGSIHKNVPVLGHLSVAEFTRTMVSITNWVAPKEGCNYCHKVNEDFSVDNVYTKVVARKMLQMTMAVNSDWKNHVTDTGVTCYTCHRGKAVPALVGNYVFADWSQNWGLPQGVLLQGKRPQNGGRWEVEPIRVANTEKFSAYITGMGQGADGELFVLTNGSNSLIPGKGRVWKLVPAP